MGCGGSKANDAMQEAIAPEADDCDGEAVGMDFYGAMDRALDTDLQRLINMEDEVRIRNETRRKEMEEAFRKFDANGDGKLEPFEIRLALKEAFRQTMGDDQLDNYIRGMMRKYDANGDGFLRIHEFEGFYQTCMATEEIKSRYLEKILGQDDDVIVTRAKKAFATYDDDKSGTIDITEFAEILLDLLPIDKHDLSESGWVRLIKDAFMEGDKDMSGTLEFDEFLKLYRKVLADENVRKEFAKKTVLKYSDEGKWQIAISA